MTAPTCKGHNYHVFPLCGARCSICGWDRYQIVDEWCPRSNHYAPQPVINGIIQRHPSSRFEVCPGCSRRLRLSWNGKFYRHKRVLSRRAGGAS